jgi:secreted PhoX family phosphatase
MTRLRFARTALAVALAAAGPACAFDFGAFVEDQLDAHSVQLFGIVEPLVGSAPITVGPYRTTNQRASDQVLLAKGLKVEYLTRSAANSVDMFSFWPNDQSPTHLIACIEGGRTQLTGDADKSAYAPGDKFNPSVQRIDLATGAVATILRGMSACDGIRTTPWGTVLATEETDDGGAYEILDPLATTDHTVKSRATGEIVDAAGAAAATAIAKRTALPVIAWEGLDITREGVIYAGDEERPGSTPGAGSTNASDRDGGAIFKFVPATPWNGTPVTSLAQSPLMAGAVYAWQASCQAKTSSSFPQYGQGCEIGQGAWVSVAAASARVDAHDKGATGFYRPEDGHFDPLYGGEGIRFCWTNTGNEGARNYGEVVCLVDTKPLGTGTLVAGRNAFTYLADSAEQRGFAVATANRFVEGDADFNSVDNLAFQPGSGIMYVIEDHENGDIFACLPDGADRDVKTDGCIKVLSVKDSSAEPTGFIFSADGTTAYLSIQHSNDANMPKVDDYPTDDVLKITGFKPVTGKAKRK